MYFVYIDESGTRDPRTEGIRSDGTRFAKPHLQSLYRAPDRLGPQVEGLKLFPDDSPLVELARDWCRAQAKREAGMNE